MSEPNFDHSDNNWDDFSHEPAWGESQWRNYLKNSDRDTARFLSFYNSLKDKPNHLDEVATLMGWDVDDLSLTDEFSSLDLDADEFSEENEAAPYTLHRHPVFVVTRALYRYLHQSWEHFIENSETKVSHKVCWKYAKSLHQGEMNVMLAIQALDLGDFGLTICHLKNGLAALNQSMAQLELTNHSNEDFLNAFRKEINIRLFDLRELWIRVMGDCRNEFLRRPGDQD